MGVVKILILGIFRAIFSLNFLVFFLYERVISSFEPPSAIASAKRLPLRIAELIPSKELALISPAASPRRYAPSPPRKISLFFFGQQTRHASRLTGAGNLLPKNSSSLAFWLSKAALQPSVLKAPPKM